MNIKKLGAILVLASMTSLFGATGSSDSDGGVKYGWAYLDCSAMGAKNYIMDYLKSDDQGFDSTKFVPKIKASNTRVKCTISGSIEVPIEIRGNEVNIRSTISHYDAAWSIINSKKIYNTDYKSFVPTKKGKKRYLQYSISYSNNNPSHYMVNFLKHYEKIGFEFMVYPTKRGEESKIYSSKLFITE
ncbi:MAG: hypothetical protein U9N59_04865 [Campylobacterota bacterium]|nr:hypothetical protein [Campylobacterota bacterium]